MEKGAASDRDKESWGLGAGREEWIASESVLDNQWPITFTGSSHLHDSEGPPPPQSPFSFLCMPTLLQNTLCLIANTHVPY